MTDIDIMPVARFNGNGMTAGLFADVWAKRDARIAEASRQLRDEFIDALKASPETVIRTPSYSPKRNTVAYVIGDNFSTREGEAALHDLLQIVQAAADGKDVRLRAMGWIAKQAREFGDSQAADYLASQEEA